MKKLIALLLVLVLSFSVSFTVFAASDKSSGKTSVKTSAVEEIQDNESSGANNGKAADKQKSFKTELNEQKKELQREKSQLCNQKEELEAEYNALIAAGDTAGAEALLETITGLDSQIKELQNQIKETINERYMVVKTMYSDEELAQFDSASALIEQMYKDAYVLKAGCITVNNNIIKFDAPSYIKGGVTLVPVRAIAEELGAEVTWDNETKTVSIVKDNVTIEMTANSTTVYVDGSPIDIGIPAEVTCGRTFVPLRFLAETLGLAVTWDGENQIIDLDGENQDGSTGDPVDDIAEDVAGDTTDTGTPEEAGTETAV